MQGRDRAVKNVKTPLKCLVFSMAAMLVGFSTTQTSR